MPNVTPEKLREMAKESEERSRERAHKGLHPLAHCDIGRAEAFREVAAMLEAEARAQKEAGLLRKPRDASAEGE